MNQKVWLLVVGPSFLDAFVGPSFLDRKRVYLKVENQVWPLEKQTEDGGFMDRPDLSMASSLQAKSSFEPREI